MEFFNANRVYYAKKKKTNLIFGYIQLFLYAKLQFLCCAGAPCT